MRLKTTRLGTSASPATDSDVTIALVADPHVPPTPTETTKLTKPITRLQTAVEDINNRDVDHVAFLGDLTKDGTQAAFDRFDGIVDGLSPQFTAIPGNHDVPKSFDDHPGRPVDTFAAEYTPNGLPFRTGVEGIDLVGLNTSVAPDGSMRDSHHGTVSDEQLEWLETNVDRDRPTIVLIHHNLPGTFDQIRDYRESAYEEVPDDTPTVFENVDALVDTLADNDVDIVFSGHVHMPSTATTRGIQEVVAPATSSFPLAYLIVEVGSEGTTIRQVPLAGQEQIQASFVRMMSGPDLFGDLASMAAIRLADFPLVDDITNTEHDD